MHLKNIVVGGVSSSPPTLIVYRYDRTRIDRIEREKQGKKVNLKNTKGKEERALFAVARRSFREFEDARYPDTFRFHFVRRDRFLLLGEIRDLIVATILSRIDL